MRFTKRAAARESARRARSVIRLAGAVLVVASIGSCERPAPASRAALGCTFSGADIAAVRATARDTVQRLKSRAQRVTALTPVEGGVSIRTEDADSTAYHNGGAVSVDCARQVTSVWLDGG